VAAPVEGFMQAVLVGLLILLGARIALSVMPWPFRRSARRPLAQRFLVVGVGGGGGNAVEAMASRRLPGVEFVACNTDAQALRGSRAGRKLQIGRSLTQGLGSGGDPEVGLRAAEVDAGRIAKAIDGAQMVFLTAGLGGGTGSGAAPIIGRIAKDQGALTIGVVTKPFAFEGPRRQEIADAAADELRANVDTLITIPNERVWQSMPEETSVVGAFRAVDDVLRQAVMGVIDVVAVRGLVNLDFADVRAVLTDGGAGVIGVGRASGDDRAIEATRQAIAATLLEDAFDGASRIVLNVTGSDDLRLAEVVQAAETVRAASDPDAHLIFGATFDAQLDDEVRVCVIATGLARRPREPRGSRPRIPIALDADDIQSLLESTTPSTAAEPAPTPTADEAAAPEHLAPPAPVRPGARRRAVRPDVIPGDPDRGDLAPSGGNGSRSAIDGLDVPAFLRRAPGPRV
jgi:cell division protein FtsZ